MNEFEEARSLLMEDLRKYLVGPAEGDREVIPERASARYHVGSLSPSGTHVSQEEDDVTDSGGTGVAEGGIGDGVLTLANASKQSAMGFTFQVPLGKRVLVDAAWADYRPEALNVEPRTDSSAEISTQDVAKDKGARATRWLRIPSQISDLDLPARIGGDIGNQILYQADGIRIEAHERLIEDLRVITISLVNRRPRREGEMSRAERLPEDRSIYQATLRVRSFDGSEVFVARSSSEFISDPEFLVHELLYRNVRQFSVGHGCATKRLPSRNSKAASEISSDWLPMSEVFKASSKVESLENTPALDVENLGFAPREKLVDDLSLLPRSYGDWIASLRGSIDEFINECSPRVAPRIRNVAQENLAACERIRERICEGIALLASDEDVFRSFVLANAAMAKSMSISRPGKKPFWRPFQMAFLLLAIPSTAHGEHPDRSTLDLIWFPTGGGKTEAYLGLVAFTLFHRRLVAATPEEGAGTAVITRYTLRLLTMQQFERAARTVMACEMLRRKSPGDLGDKPFSIGLFVGNAVTPRDLETARKVIDGTSEDRSLVTLPVAKCPWCSGKLRVRDQKIDTSLHKVVTRCASEHCDFHGGIPIACVDEELFANPPSMVIGTVDKFAMMAWEPSISNLFGRGHGHLPPNLIIQDEFHLISDALGSMTGLYETAVDLLCSTSGSPPKVVGSTATIRRAAAQARCVFAREVAQFPPSGLSHDDSFFYREDRSNPGRMYLGVHAQGRSPKHTLARLIGILGQGALAIEHKEAQDRFWTLVAYFNSLRELGGAWVLALDDVPKYIKAMPAKKQADRRIGEPTELTSAIPSTLIPGVLERIAASKTIEDDDHEPIGLLLCTNMISVGVDIDRLGLMIVNGQPKTTAEYIQASSRVGRPEGDAGLVVTLYNWTRPRDRSHYERFRSYHESFYRNVESTSVTPFSMRAMDRGLHGVFVALLRLMIPTLAKSPKDVDEQSVVPQVEAIMDAIVDRARRVATSSVAQEVREELEMIRREIRSVAEVDGDWQANSGTKPRYLRRPNEPRGIRGGVETPQSMRDVDPTCIVELKPPQAV